MINIETHLTYDPIIIRFISNFYMVKKQTHTSVGNFTYTNTNLYCPQINPMCTSILDPGADSSVFSAIITNTHIDLICHD